MTSHSATELPARPLLYTYRRCPYAMRARMALIAAEVDFDAHEIVLREKPPAMLLASPKGTVPVLLRADGSVLEQSLDIMEWALCEKAHHALWASTQTTQGQALIALNDGAFKRHLDRYKYPERFPDTTAAPWGREAHRNAATQCLLVPVQDMLCSEVWLGGRGMGALDIAVFPFVRQFAAVDAAWFEREAPLPVQRWLHACVQSPLFLAAMTKLPAQRTVRWREAASS